MENKIYNYSEKESFTLMTWLADELQQLAHSKGYKNIFQPGLMREIIVANILGHIPSGGKRGIDAYDRNNPDLHYEYLASNIGIFQMDRMYGYTKSKSQQQQSLDRITRNENFFHILFDKENPLKPLKIWKINTNKVLEEAKQQLSVSAADHLSFSLPWTEENGTLVYECEDVNA
jgi:hypothetical protein